MNLTSALTPEELAADQGPQMTVTITTLCILATVFVGLRFWARVASVAGYGPDDWVLVGALILTWVLGGTNYAMIRAGMGKHQVLVTGRTQMVLLQELFAFEMVYLWNIVLVKASLLLMFWRLFPSPEFRMTVKVLGGVVLAWGVSMTFVAVFQCDPIEKSWLPRTPGTCINRKVSLIANAIPNILTDLAILLAPVFQVWRLRLTRTQRMSISLMFLLGGFVLFASCYRFITLTWFDPKDTTWTLAPASIWCVIEMSCAIISAVLPTLRPLMVKMSGQFGSLGSSVRSHAGGRSRSRSHNSDLSSCGRCGSGGDKLKGARELVSIGGGGGGGGGIGKNTRDFYRLEEAGGEEKVRAGHECPNSVTTTVKGLGRHGRGRGSDDGGGIRIQTDVVWTRDGGFSPTFDKGGR